MSQLIVRNLDERIVRALRQRAARAGRSAEAEHRRILEEALDGRRQRGSLKALLQAMPDVGEDADFERPRDTGRPVDL